ncbi:hypothetical protein B0H21DRAFT_30234 [Amylocystis lapponica]|nr:hypothetical protein B0H21DRAFT_30234 [Amylocystis lapponica]
MPLWRTCTSISSSVSTCARCVLPGQIVELSSWHWQQTWRRKCNIFEVLELRLRHHGGPTTWLGHHKLGTGVPSVFTALRWVDSIAQPRDMFGIDGRYRWNNCVAPAVLIGPCSTPASVATEGPDLALLKSPTRMRLQPVQVQEDFWTLRLFGVWKDHGELSKWL